MTGKTNYNMNSCLLAHESLFWLELKAPLESIWYHPDYPEKWEIDALATYSNLFFPPMFIEDQL